MSIIEEGRRVLLIEAEALEDLINRIGASFEKAVRLVLDCAGKVIVTGMGKSGQVGRKISSTLSSTGTPSVFLHPGESWHGDLGSIGAQDLILAISYSGETNELQAILNRASRLGVRVIGMTGKPESTLARASSVVLDIHVKKEACPLGLAPTSSSTATMALGDALAMAVLKQRGFREEDFAEFHPGGALGKRLLTRVKDVMHSGRALPLVGTDMSMKEVITVMTARDVRGIAGVINSEGLLVGVITDGDLRRRLHKSEDPLKGQAQDVMSRSPKTIDHNELAERALFLMQQFNIQTLFAVDQEASQPTKPVGLLHLQDLLKSQVL